MILTRIAIYLMIINGFIISFGITQKVLDLNLFDESIEALMWALVGSFQLVLLSFYLAARRNEDVMLVIAIQNIESLLTHISQTNNLFNEEKGEAKKPTEGKLFQTTDDPVNSEKVTAQIDESDEENSPEA
jgi:hypothetical protein